MENRITALVSAAAGIYYYFLYSCMVISTPVCAQRCSSSVFLVSTLRPHHWRPCSPPLAACTTTARACERSGAAKFLAHRSSIYGSPAHRSIPTPTTSRSAPLIWLLDPLRSRSAPHRDY